MYSFDSRVRYSECDETGTLTLTGLINYLQDCSTFQTEELGHGVAYLRDHHIAWLLAAWQIEIVRMPRLCDPITVSTWCYLASRTQAGRNFLIADPMGDPYVRADSLWFVFDTKSRRPVRIPEDELVYLEETPRLDMPPTERKLQADGDSVEATPTTILAHHLDTNGHVNNAQYVAMAVDAARERLGSTAPRRVCVQYRRMALLGDVIVPHVHVRDDGCLVSLADPAGEAYAVIRLACAS